MKYKEEDETAALILVVVTCAALLSLVAIVLLLSTVKHVAAPTSPAHRPGRPDGGDFLAAVPTMFTLHYADAFYSADDDDGRSFSADAAPGVLGFRLFSFTISAACQTADVSTANTPIRRTVLVHSVIAFVFNASILGFAVNISAGLLSG